MVKIRLRYQKISDAKRFFEILSNPDFKYFSARPKTLKEEIKYLKINAKKRDGKKDYNFAIIMDHQVVGATGIRRDINRRHIAETGYFIDKDFWGKGIATKALNQIEKIAFNRLGIKRLEMRIMPVNKGSIRVAEKCGFKREGLLKKGCVYKEGYSNAYLYAKVR